jgi:hypothetical protein
MGNRLTSGMDSKGRQCAMADAITGEFFEAQEKMVPTFT